VRAGVLARRRDDVDLDEVGAERLGLAAQIGVGGDGGVDDIGGRGARLDAADEVIALRRRLVGDDLEVRTADLLGLRCVGRRGHRRVVRLVRLGAACLLLRRRRAANQRGAHQQGHPGRSHVRAYTTGGRTNTSDLRHCYRRILKRAGNLEA
jgi:hypothetical protein